LLGHAYFRKAWRTDGVREYDSALKWRPASKTDATMIRNAVTALDDPTFKAARALIRNGIGAPALAELRRAAHGRVNSKVQKRAERLVLDLTRSVHAKRRR